MSVFLTKIRPDSPPETVAAAVQSVVPGAVTVRMTAVLTTRRTASRAELRYVALALAAGGRALPIPKGGTSRLAQFLQQAYPDACWSGSCRWSAESGLARLQPRRPRHGGGHPYAAA